MTVSKFERGREAAAVPWVLCELRFVWREAQAEAELAYETWSEHPTQDGYAVYRAAQDQADSAQDELAAWAHAPPVEDHRPRQRAYADDSRWDA